MFFCEYCSLHLVDVMLSIKLSSRREADYREIEVNYGKASESVAQTGEETAKMIVLQQHTIQVYVLLNRKILRHHNG